MADENDIGHAYANELQNERDAALERRYLALAEDAAPSQPEPAPEAPAPQATAGDSSVTGTVARNLSEIPTQFLFGALSAGKEAGSKVGVGDGEPVGWTPETLTGAVSRSAGQFLPGYALASAALTALPASLAGAGMVALAAKARPLIAGIVAGTLDFDHNEPRVSNFINEMGLGTPFTEWLAADPNDGMALGTFKSAIENAGMGAASEGIVALARMNRARIVSKRALEAAGAKSPEQIADDASRVARDILDPPVDRAKAMGGDPAGDAVQILDTPAAERLADAAERSAGVEPGDVAEAVSPNPQRIYLNLARIDTPDDVKGAIDTLASRDADAINAARGGETQTFEQMQALADQMGLSVDGLVGRRRGPMGAAEAVASRKLLTSSGEQLTELARKAGGAEATPADLSAFQKSLAVHYAIQTEVIAARTETARALASWRIPTGGADLRLSDVEQALSAAGGAGKVRDIAARFAMMADNPTAMAKFTREGFRTGWSGRAFKQLWFNGLLSSPRTHIANITDNALTAMMAVPERAATSLVSNTFGGGDVGLGEAQAMMWGMMRGAREGLKAAGKALRTGEGSDLFTKIEANAPRAISADTFGANPDSAWGHAVNAMGVAIDVPSRLLMSADEFFKSVGYRQELHALAFREAHGEGLTGRALAERMADIIENPPDSLLADSINFGRTNTYTNKLGPVAGKIAELRDSVNIAGAPVGHFVAPFVRTPANIFKYSFERTPLAPLSSAVREDMLAGGVRREAALAKIGMGSMAMLAAADMVAHGQMVGGGPAEPGLRAARERMNIPQYAVKIGGDWVEFSRLGYVGTLLGLAADAAELGGWGDFEDQEKTAAATALLFAKSLANKSYLQGIFQLASIIGEPENDRRASNYAQKIVAGLVPFSGLGSSAKNAMDPVQRETQDAEAGFIRESLNRIRSRTPGLSDSLPPVRNLWGEPKEYTSNLGVAYDFAIPFNVRSEDRDPVDEAILANGINVQMPDRNIQRVPLTGEEHSEYVRRAGESAKEILDEIVSDPEFKELSDGPDGMKAAQIKDVISQTRAAARASMIEDFPELRQRIEAQELLRQQLLTGEAPR